MQIARLFSQASLKSSIGINRVSNELFDNSVSGRYAKAIFSAAGSSGSLDDVERDFKALNDGIKKDNQMAILLKDPSLNNMHRVSLINSFINDKCSLLVSRFISLLADNNRLELLPGITMLVLHAFDSLNSPSVATITSASVWIHF